MEILKKIKVKSVAAFVLIVMMVFTLLPVTSFAADEYTYDSGTRTLVVTSNYTNWDMSSPRLYYQESGPYYAFFEEGVTTVDTEGLYLLKEVTIASTVTTLYFADTYDVEKLVFKGATPPSTVKNWEADSAAIYVPAGSEDAYKAALPSSVTANIQTDPDTVSEEHEHTLGEEVRENEVAATCTQAGSYDAVVYCAECGEEISRETVIVDALGHDYVDGICSRCGEADPDYVIDIEVDHAHTFTEDGFCEDCGEYNPDDEDGTYVITTEEQLAEIARAVNAGDTFSGDTIRLGADIDLAAYESWTAIGMSTAPFEGTFDGQNRSITNLVIGNDASDYRGLFGYSKGIVKDFSISGIIGTESAPITKGADNIGGAVGYNDGTVSGVKGNVSINVKAAIYAVGGIVGQNGDNALVTGCLNEADLTVGKASGGIVGRNFGEITLCKNTGNITGTQGGKDGVGGIAGYGGNKNSTYKNSITYCYNTGTTSNPGGRWQGGIVGFADSATTVTNCYSIGTVKAGYSWNWNAIIGHVDSAYSTVYDNYSLDTITNGDTNASTKSVTIGTQLSEAEMKADAFVTQINGAGDGFKSSCGTTPVLSWEEAAEHDWSAEGTLVEAGYHKESGIIPGYTSYTCTKCGAEKKEAFENKYTHDNAKVYVTGKDGETVQIAEWVYVEPQGDGIGTYYDKATGEKLAIIKDFTDPANLVGTAAGHSYDLTDVGVLAYAGITRKPSNPTRQAITVSGILMEDLIDYAENLSGTGLRGATKISWTAADGSSKAGTQVYKDFYTQERFYFPQYYIDQTMGDKKYSVPYSLAIIGFQAAQGEVASIAEELPLADSMNAIRNFQGQALDENGEIINDGNLGNLSTQGIIGFLFEPAYNEIEVTGGTLSGTDGADATYTVKGAVITSDDNWFKAAEGEEARLHLTATGEDGIGTVSVADADGNIIESVYADGILSFTMPETAVSIDVALVCATHDFTEDGFCSKCGQYNPEDTDNTYVITTAEQLAEISRAVSAGDDFKGDTVQLANDISLAGFVNFAPIGGNATRVSLTITSQEELNAALEEHYLIYDQRGVSYVRGSEKNEAYDENRSYYYQIGAPFAGTFDGAGNEITDLKVETDTGYAGLFGDVSGTVKDLTVTGTVTSTSTADYFGGIAGKLSAGGLIENCKSYVDVTSNGFNTGGVVGFVGEMGKLVSDENPIATVKNCGYYGTVCSAKQRVGGITGRNAGLIEGCANHGTVKTTYNRKIGLGGIAGFNGVNNAATDAGIIRDCYNDGTIDTNGCYWSGGIAGFQNAKSSVENCYNAGLIVNGKNGETGQPWSMTNPLVGQSEGVAKNLIWLDKEYDSMTDTYKGSDSTGIYNSGGSVENVEGKTEDALKAAEVVEFLNGNEAYKLNRGGYPVLTWEEAGILEIADADGSSQSVKAEDLDAAEPEGATSKSYGDGANVVEAKFYSVKTLLANAGYDLENIHGVKAISSDGFVTGFDKEMLDELYIYDMSQATLNGETESSTVQYRTAVDGSAGNKWAKDVVKIELATDHVWFVKGGKCRHFCSICGEAEPMAKDADGNCLHNYVSCGADEASVIEIADAEGNTATIHVCEFAAAEPAEATSKSYGDGANVVEAKFYSVKTLLANAGYDLENIHGVKAISSDGFVTGFDKEMLDELYIYDMSQATLNGETESSTVQYRTAVDGSAGNKWAKDVVKIELATDHVWFVKGGKCRHFCSICGEAEPVEEPVWTWAEDLASASAMFKYISCGEEVTVEAEVTSEITKEPTATETGEKTYTAKATLDGKAYTDTKIEEVPEVVVAVTGVTLSKTSGTLTEGDTLSLKATVAPADATNQDVTWSSSNAAVAKVDTNGKVTAVKAGTATITVTTADGSMTADCKITVKAKEVKIKGIKLNKTSAEIPTKSTLQLKVTFTPADTTQTGLIWKSSNPSIASVDKNGKVTAKIYGKPVTITVTSAADSSFKATCKIQTRLYDATKDNVDSEMFKAIYWAVDHDISGMDVHFKTKESMTRGQFVHFLWNMAGKPAVNTKKIKNPFADVNSKTAHYKQILWAVDQGLIDGYKEGSKQVFKPEGTLTRQNVATILWKFAKKPKVSNAKKPFADVAKSAAIAWGKSKGIFKADSSGKFKPKANCIRGDFAVFLYRYNNKYKVVK